MSAAAIAHATVISHRNNVALELIAYRESLTLLAHQFLGAVVLRPLVIQYFRKPPVVKTVAHCPKGIFVGIQGENETTFS